MCESDCETSELKYKRHAEESKLEDKIRTELRLAHMYPELSRKSRQAPLNINRTARTVSLNSNLLLGTAVCGSDQITYSSECSLKTYQCRLQRRINKAHMGQCRPGARPGKGSGKVKSGFSKAVTSHSSVPQLPYGQSVTQHPVRRSTLEKTTRELFSDPLDSSSAVTQKVTPTQSSGMAESTIRMSSEHQSAEVPDRSQWKKIYNALFMGRSWARFDRLRAYRRLLVELRLTAFSDNGLILYNGQSPTGQGDFVSLALNNGYLEFRFNLGSGPVLIRSLVKVRKYHSVRILLRREGRRGWLRMDQMEWNTTAEGQLSSLDLSEHLYVGNVPNAADRVWENVGLFSRAGNSQSGFVGCLHELRVSDTQLQFVHTGGANYEYGRLPGSGLEVSQNQGRGIHVGSSEIEPAVLEINDNPLDDNFLGNRLQAADEIGECISLEKNRINYCELLNVCKGQSTCVNLAEDSFDCLCNTAITTGSSACWATDANGLRPSELGSIDFYGDSYLQLSTLNNVAAGFVIELWFLPRSGNGLLLYNGQKKSNLQSGDFLSLQLQDAWMQFAFDLGSKVPNQR